MTIAVSLGDPAGIGPEIAVKTWQEIHDDINLKFVVFGDYKTIVLASKQFNVKCEIINLKNPCDEFDFSKSIGVYEPIELKDDVVLGVPNPKNGNAIIKYIESATQFVMNGDFCAITTLPISKAPLYEAGFKHKGHTEFVADLCKDIEYKFEFGPIMMLMIDGLKVALSTIHIPLNEVANSISTQSIFKTIKICHEAMQNDFGIKSPKIAVLGLNPHAGEKGTIGKEELQIINPACQMARDFGIDCTDALPSDSAFASFNRSNFDCYVAMYHDQGLIPIKALDFWGGVNVTLGLPIIRTSPDHGTGYEIANKNIANPLSFINALKTAKIMAQNRAKIHA